MADPHPGWPLPIVRHWLDLDPYQIDACVRTRGIWYPGKSVSRQLRREIDKAQERPQGGQHVR